MNRYLFRVQYTLPDESIAYESVVVIAASETAARTDVEDATERYMQASGSTRMLTLLSTTVEA